MNIVWIECDNLERGADHGIDFTARSGNGPGEVIAVLRGFEWLHRRPDVVEIAIRPPGKGLDASFLEEARRSIERYVRNPGDLGSYVSESVWAGING
jgi:hypothetical protein